MRNAFLGLTLLLAIDAPARAASKLETLLDKASLHATAFKRDFAEVVAAESYRQTLTEVGRRARERQIESEMFFVSLNDEGEALNVRRVLKVDGVDVPSPSERYERALNAPRTEARRALLTLANEGARYNLGELTRNFSDPTLALLFVSRERRARFRFKEAGHETVDGHHTTRVAFEERARPTLIREGRLGSDVPVSGVLFIDADGRVWRTEMRLGYGTVRASMRVAYQHDANLGMLVPSVMDEEYQFRSGLERRPAWIVCRAEYRDFRKFRTEGRLVAPLAAP